MTEQPSAIEVPASHDTYGRVVCRIIRRVGDGDDTGTTPDALPMSGSVTFTPLTKWDRTSSYSAFASNEPVTCLLNPLTGEMMSPGQPPIVGVDLLVGPYRATFKLDHGTLDPFNVEVKATHTQAAPLDLVHEAPYSPPPGVQHSVLVPSGITSGHLLAYSGGQIVGVDPASLGGDGGGVDPAAIAAAVEDYLTANPPAGGDGVTDHGLLTGLDDDDHPQYALADGTRGVFAAPLGPDDNYVTDAEKAALHSHANQAALDAVSGVNTGDQDLSDYATTTALNDGLADKADAAHTHSISDVGGLQSALDGKQASGSYAAATHTHTATDIDSGAATDGHVLTADGAGGAAWEPPPAGGGGSGVTADDTPAVPAEGQSASYLVTSAVTWPAGLVWSDDPDGGEAPTITGAALVSLFTVDGVTRAVMGATFPALPAPPDTTAPVAGTRGVAPSSTSALGTVTGASDAVALAAAPYSFRLDAGAWSAWQASASYTWTGLAASTGYTFQHRVVDAAGNITEGAAVTGTTDPAADSTPPTVGTMTATSVSDSGFTVTITGAADETALDAAPYAFTIDGGTTWTAYQASATYTATGLTAETAYTANWRVKDAAGNVSTGTAQTVTTTAAPAGSSFDAAVLALSPVAYWPMEETSGATINDITGNGHHLTHNGVEGVDYTRSSTGTRFLTNLGAATCPTAPAFNLETAGFSVLMIPERELGADKNVFVKGDELKVQSASTAYYAGYRANRKWVRLSYSAGEVVSFTTHMMTVTAPAAATGAVPLHYINGNASVGAISGSAAWVTGRDGDISVGSFANGKYRKLAFFNRQLTPAEIASLYAAAQAEGLAP